MAFAPRLLLAVVGAALAVCITAAPTACTGNCLSSLSLFDASTANVCDSAHITVTGTTSGTIYGGDIYRWNGNMAKAATHMGIVTVGQTKNIYAYWAGIRPAFQTIFKNSIWSYEDVVDTGGVILSESATCPSSSFSATMTPITNIEYKSGSSIFGTGWWRYDAPVNSAAQQFGYVDASTTTTYSGVLYLHNTVDDHPFFLDHKAGGVTSSDSRTPEEAYRLDPSPTYTYDPNATYVRLDGTKRTTCRGFGTYSVVSSVAAVAVHAGIATWGQTVWIWIHHNEYRKIFYRSNQNGVSCPASGLSTAYPAIWPSLSATQTPPAYDDIVTATMFLDDLDLTPTVYGTTYYRYNSDFNQAAYHRGLMNLGQVVTVYIHYVGIKNFFYKSNYMGMRSLADDTPDDAAYISLVPTPPTADELKRVLLRFQKTETIVGIGFYKWDSELSSAAVHNGQLDAAETKELYLHEFTPPVYLGGNSRGIKSNDWTSSQPGYFLSASPTDPNPFLTYPWPISIKPTGYTCSTIQGVWIYRYRSDLACIVRHIGLVQLGEEKVVWVHSMGNQPFFRSARMNGIRSTYYDTSPNLGIVITDSSTPVTNPGDPSTNVVKVPLSFPEFDTSVTVTGAGVYEGESDVRMAAYLEGLINVADGPTDIYIHPIASPPPELPKTCRGVYCSSTYATVPVNAFALSLTATNPHAGLPAGTWRTHAQFIPQYDSSALTGFRETGYRILSSVSRAAYVNEIIDVYEEKEVFYHVYPPVTTGFFGSVWRNVKTSATQMASGEQAILVTETSARPTFDQNIRPFTACYNNTDETPDLRGAHVYSYHSDVQQAAYAEYLIDHGECKTLYLHAVGSHSLFIGARLRDITSTSSTGTYSSFIITDSATAVSAPTDLYPLKMSFSWNEDASPDVKGAGGLYKWDSELAAAAYLEGLLAYGDDTPVQIYAHKFTTVAYFNGMTTRGVNSGYASGPANGFILTTSATRPTLGTTRPVTLTYTHIGANPSTSGCHGLSYFRRDCNILTAAAMQGLIRPGETKTVYIHDIGVKSFFLASSRDGFTVTSYDSATREAFTVTDTATFWDPTTSSAIEFTVNISEVPSGSITGTEVFTRDSDIVTAAYHEGLLELNVETTLYVHSIGVYSGIFYGTLRNGIKSSSSIVAEEAVMITTSTTAPTVPGTLQAMTVTAEQRPNEYTVSGCGYYRYTSDPVGAAVYMGLLRVGETATIYVTDLGTSVTKYYACHGSSASTPGTPVRSFHVSLTNAAHAITANVVEVSIKPEATATVHGMYVFRQSSNLETAAMQVGLATYGQRVTVYVHDIGDVDNFYSATSAGKTSTRSGATDNAFIVSTSATAPSGADLPTATVQKVVIVWDPSQPLGAVTGTGKYRDTSDLTATAIHMGIMDEDTAMPFTFFVHRIGSGGPLYRSWNHGVESVSSTSTSLDLIVPSTASAALPACMTTAGTAYAYVRGETHDSTAYGATQYLSTSHVNFAAVHSGAMSEGEAMVVRITDVTSGGSYTSTTNNGVTSTASGSSSTVAFTTTAATCAGFSGWPADDTSPPAVTCTGDCSAAEFPSGSSTTDGTMATVVMRGKMLVSGTIKGSGIYEYDQPWDVMAVHAGVLKPGETKTIYAFYYGRTMVYDSFRWFQGNDRSSTSMDCVYFSTSSTAPTFGADTTPIKTSFSLQRTAYGIGYFRATSDVATSAFVSGMLTPFQTTTIFVHGYASVDRRFWSANHKGVATADVSATDEAFIVTSAETPVPAAPTLSTQVTLECGWFRTPGTGYGHGVWRLETDICDAAQHWGWFAGSEVSKTFYIHETPTTRRFWPAATSMYGSYMQRSTSNKIGYTISTSSSYTWVDDVYPVRIDMSTGVFFSVALYGVPNAYSDTSDVRKAAYHEGLVRPGTSWQGFLHYEIGTKEHVPSMYRNGILSLARPTGTNKVFAFSDQSTHPGTDPFGPSTVTAVEVDPIPSFVPVSTTEGFHSVYSYLGEVVTAAHHSGLTQANAPLPTQLYLHAAGSKAHLPAGINFGVRTSIWSSNVDCYVFSDALGSYDTDYTNNGKAELNIVALFGTHATKGFYVYDEDSDVATAAWQSGQVTSFDTTVTRYIHYDSVNTRRLFAGANRGIRTTYGSGKAIFITTSSDPNDAATSPVQTKDVYYICRGVKLPNLSPRYLTHSGSLNGAGKYYELTRVDAAAYHYGIVYFGETVDIHVHWNPTQDVMFGAAYRGVKTAYRAAGYGYTVSVDGISPYISATVTHVRLACHNSEAFSDSSTVGTVVYKVESLLCPTAIHDSRIPIEAPEGEVWVHEVQEKIHFESLRNGISSTDAWSSSTLRDSYVFASVPGTTTPSYDIDHLEVSNLWCMPTVGSAPAYGASIFAVHSDMSKAALLGGVCEIGDVLPTVYFHGMGTQVMFYAHNYRQSWSSTAAVTSRPGYMLSTSSTAPPANDGSKVEVTIKTTYFTAGYGCSVAYYSNSVANAAFCASLVLPGETTTVWVYFLPTSRGIMFTRPQKSWGLDITFYDPSGGAMRGYFVAPDDGADSIAAQIDSTQQYVNISIHEFTFGSPYGTTFYRRDAYLTDAAYHYGVLTLGETGAFWVHAFPSYSPFLSSESRGVKSLKTNSAQEAYTLSGSPYAPDPSSPVMPINVIGDIILGATLEGNGVYTIDSDINMAAYHAGLVKLGEQRTIYIHRLTHDKFHASLNNGVMSTSVFTSHDAFIPWHSGTLPSCLFNTATHVAVRMLPPDAPPSPLAYGGDSGVYEETSNVMSAAFHSGLLVAGDDSRMVRIDYVASHATYPALVANGIATEAATGGDPGFTLSDTDCGAITRTVSETICTTCPSTTPAPPTTTTTTAAATTTTTAAPTTTTTTTAAPATTTTTTTPAPTTTATTTTTTAAATTTTTTAAASGSTTTTGATVSSTTVAGGSTSTATTTAAPGGSTTTTDAAATTTGAAGSSNATTGDSQNSTSSSASTTTTTAAPTLPPTPAPPIPPFVTASVVIAPGFYAASDMSLVQPPITEPLRRGETATASISFSAGSLTQNTNSSQPDEATLRVTVSCAAGGIMVPANLEGLDSRCTSTATTLDCRVPVFSDLTRRFVVPFIVPLVGVHGRAALAVDVSVDNWSPDTVVEAANFTTPPSFSTTAEWPTVLSTGLTLSDLVVTSVTPPLNAMQHGQTVNITGENLQLLPAMQPAALTIVDLVMDPDAPSGTRAFVVVPPAVEAWSKGSARAALPVAEDMAAEVALDEEKRLFVSLLTPDTLSVLDAARDNTALGGPVDLATLTLDIVNAEVAPTPTLPPSVTQPTVGDGNNTQPDVPAIATSPGGETTVPIQIPVTPGSPPPDPADLIATVTIGNQTIDSTGVGAVVPIRDDTGTVVGYTVDFVFNGSLADAGADNSTDSTAGGDSTNRTATLAGGGGTIAMDVTVTDVNAHTTFTSQAVFAIPAVRVAVETLAPYRVALTIGVASSSSVSDVRVLAYTDLQRTDFGYPTRCAASNSTVAGACAYDSANLSVSCGPQTLTVSDTSTNRRIAVTAPSEMRVELFARVPSYFVRDIFARVHVTSANAEPKQLVVRLARDTVQDVLVSVGNPAAATTAAPAPGGQDASLTTTTQAPTPPPPLMPSTTSAPALGGQAISRGIFDPSAAGCGVQVNIVAATVLVFVIALVIRMLISLVLRRNPKHLPEAIRTYDSRALRSLASAHAYVGFILPCHHFCGPIHTALFLVHVFTFFAVGSAMVNMSAGIVHDSGSLAAAAPSAALTAFAAMIIRPLANWLFTMYTLRDERSYAVGFGKGFDKRDLSEFGVRGSTGVGVSRSTAVALVNLTFDDSDPTGARAASHEPRGMDIDDVEPQFPSSSSPSGGSPTEQPVAPPAGRPNSTRGELKSAPTTASVEDTTSSSAGSADMHISEARMANDPELLLRADIQTAVRDTHTCVVVDAARFAIAGWLLFAFLSISFAIWTVNNTRSWCEEEYSAFFWLLAWSAAMDIIVLQPLFLGATQGWRYINTDEEDVMVTRGIDDDEEIVLSSGCAALTIHELHPIHGQWRYVGGLATAIDHDAE